MPAPSSTINKTRLKGDELGIKVLLFRRVIAVSRAHCGFVFHAAHFEFDRTIFSVASFVGWIVTQTVLRADVLGYLRKRSARICKRGRDHASTARHTREII